jgi:hypothetical protein
MPSPFQSQENPPQESSQQETNLSEFGSQYLEGIPEADRAVVEKYVKDWDGNVTRKFQEYSNSLKKYEELGDIATLTNAQTVLQDIQNDPVGFYEYFKDYLLQNEDFVRETYGVENLAERLGIQMQENSTGLPEHDGMDDGDIQLSQALEQINALSQKIEQMESSTREQEQMKMLDSTLEKMHTEHGDFDDTFVLTQIAGGQSPEKAIENWNKLKQSIIDSHSETPPPLLTGPAGTPLDQVDLAKLKDPASRKEIGAKILERSLRS